MIGTIAAFVPAPASVSPFVPAAWTFVVHFPVADGFAVVPVVPHLSAAVFAFPADAASPSSAAPRPASAAVSECLAGASSQPVDLGFEMDFQVRTTVVENLVAADLWLSEDCPPD